MVILLTLPPSMRSKAIRLPPSSVIAMHIGTLIASALARAPAMMLRASAISRRLRVNIGNSPRLINAFRENLWVRFSRNAEQVTDVARVSPYLSGLRLQAKRFDSRSGFGVAAATVKDRLGIAVGLICPFQHQLQSRLKGDIIREIRRQRCVACIIRILLVHDERHSLERRFDLFCVDQAML